MYNPRQTENELLKTLLEPLLEDFRYWFSRARTLLETERLTFLTIEEQADLLDRVKQAQGEVATAYSLYKVTGGQVGIETRTLVPWHQLVAECWRVSSRWRAVKGEEGEGRASGSRARP
jgi:hypothetical protein